MRHVLFVDDDEDLLVALARAVSRSTWRCLAHFAASGELALKALQQAPFDVIVTDWHMPRMNGAELLERVEAAYPQIVRVILSSHPAPRGGVRGGNGGDG